MIDAEEAQKTYETLRDKYPAMRKIHAPGIKGGFQLGMAWDPGGQPHGWALMTLLAFPGKHRQLRVYTERLFWGGKKYVRKERPRVVEEDEDF